MRTLATYFAFSAMFGASLAAQAQQSLPAPSDTLQGLPQSDGLPFADPGLKSSYCKADMRTTFVEKELGVLYCETGRIDRFQKDRLCAGLQAHINFNELMIDFDVPPLERSQRQADNERLQAAMEKLCLTN